MCGSRLMMMMGDIIFFLVGLVISRFNLTHRTNSMT